MLSLPLHSKLSKGILWHKPVVFQNTTILDHLHYNPSNVSSVVHSTVLPSFKLHSQVLQHFGQIAALHLIETGKQFSNVNPLGGILWERDPGQDTLREQTLSDIPRTGQSERKGVITSLVHTLYK